MSEIIVDGKNINISYYPDGSPRIEYNINSYSRNIKKIVFRPKNMSSFMASMFFLDSLTERNINIEQVSIPFIMGARQDRLTNGENEDFLFTAKSICKEVNSRNMKIETFDPHSDVLSACLDRPIIKSVCEIFNECNTNIFDIKNYDGIISPDQGSSKKCVGIAKKFGINSILFANKNRNLATGKIEEISISKNINFVCGGKYIVIDDICDGGGTFIKLFQDSELIKSINVDLYVTHGIFSKGTDDLLNLYRNIYCTDSTCFEKPGVKLIEFFGDKNGNN